jgi:hypothetical protein
MKKRAAAVLGLGVLLAGCGGDDGPQGLRVNSSQVAELVWESIAPAPLQRSASSEARIDKGS